MTEKCTDVAGANANVATIEKKRLDEILDALVNVARGDYRTKLELSPRNDDLDAIVMGLNMMIDDIGASFEKEKKRMEELRKAHQELKDAQEASLNIMEDLDWKRKELAALNLNLQRETVERMRAEKERQKLVKERARMELYSFIVSALPVFAVGIPAHARDVLVSTFAERFERNLKPRFVEDMARHLDDMGSGGKGKDDPKQILTAYLAGVAALFSNFDIRVETSDDYPHARIDFLNCPWTSEMERNPIFCLLCRAVVYRSFRWTSLTGGTSHRSSLIGGADRCSFEFHVVPDYQS